MMIGGAMKREKEELEDMEDDEERVTLMVHDIKPPFLDGRIVFTK
jgi:pre-mRNA-splicing factor ATP-dependent RNA helicase DHX38/PRP16